MIRVLVLAASAIVRAGLEVMLREDPRFSVLDGSAGQRSNADVLLLESEGDRLAGRLDGLRGAAGVVVLTDELRRAELRRALQNGVGAVLSRRASSAEVAAAIEAVAAGLIVLTAEHLERLLPASSAAGEHEDIAGEALTARETEVLNMMAEGLGNKEIASRLHLSEHTVKFHVSSVLSKLGAETRTEAVTRALREGLILL